MPRIEDPDAETDDAAPIAAKICGTRIMGAARDRKNMMTMPKTFGARFGLEICIAI
jgi:hypothetical protein